MNIVELFKTFGIEVTMRQGTHIIELLLCIFACITGLVSNSIISGSNVLLGQSYGKTHIFRTIFKYLLLLLSILLWLALIAFFAMDLISNFFSIAKNLGYVLIYIIGMFIGGVVLISLCWAWGKRISVRSEEKRDKKYIDEIDTILMNNPVFVEALNIIKSDDKIKMIKVFRDGISFHTSVVLPKQNETIKITYGANSNSEAEKMLKNEEDAVLEKEGSVLNSNINTILRYSSYNFATSETAMLDLSKWLSKYLEPRFATYSYEINWEYEQTVTNGPTGYIVHNDRVTPTGSSSKTIKAYRGVIVSEILYTQTNNEPERPNNISSTQNLKNW